LAPVCAWGAESPLRVVDVEAGGKGIVARQARVLLPPEPAARRRVVILLHGRGEAKSARLGLRAWPELYGLVETDARLRGGRVAPELAEGEVGYTGSERLAELQQDLDRQPYRGMVFVCPVTPDPASQPNRERFFDAYARWLTEELIAAVKAVAPEARSFALDGCSMGGPIALETFLRHPKAFAALGMVQSAFGAFRAPGYAKALRKAFDEVGPKPVHLLTSSQDDFREANEALSRELSERRVAAELSVPRGPHNQPFLRQIGTLLAIRWHDRTLPR
jgi:pimeloyl-ACP methyl ester carboxylesterase